MTDELPGSNYRPRGARLNRSITPLLALALLVAAPFRLIAQAQPEFESAFLTYAKATTSYDTQRMSQLMHPEAVKRLRATIDAALQGSQKEQAATELLPLFSVTEAAEFAKLPEVEVYKRLNDTIAKSSPELLKMMSSARYEIVGSFMKGDLAYITYKLHVTIEGKQISPEVVQTLKMHEGKWLLMLPSTAEAAIAGIESRFPK